jgi:two-component system, OmpR family, sensor kinase
MNRSLRFRVAARIGAAMMAAVAVMSVIGVLGARLFLDNELNANLLNVASIQAGAVTDAPSGEMVFHEWDLTPAEAAQVRELNRFAQVWSASGESLLRTQYITEDLPRDTEALQRAAAGWLIMKDQQFQEMPIRSLYYPLERMGAAHAAHVLQVAAPLTGRNRLLRQLTGLLLTITLISGAASFLGGWWLASRVVRPVHEIIDQAESMGAGTLGRRIEADADEQEYERLIAVLNSLLARLEGAFDSQRRFIADASHELRSPLTALKGEMELALRRERSSDEYRRVLRSGLQEVDRLTLLTQDLLTLARVDAGVMQPRLEMTDAVERAAVVLERLRGSCRPERYAVASLRVRLPPS